MISLTLTWRATPVNVTQAQTTYNNDVSITTNRGTYQRRTEYSNTRIGGNITGDGITVSEHDRETGAEADTAADAIDLPAGTTSRPIVIQVTNSGTTSLRNFTVADSIIEGSGELSGLYCDFSAWGGSDHVDATTDANGELVVSSLTAAEAAAVAAGTTPVASKSFAVAVPAGEHFSCYATVEGIVGVHGDNVTVTAYGNAKVQGDNPFYAKGDEPAFAVSKVSTDKTADNTTGLVKLAGGQTTLDRSYTVTVKNTGSADGTSAPVYDTPAAHDGFTITGVTVNGQPAEIADGRVALAKDGATLKANDGKDGGDDEKTYTIVVS